MEQTGFLKDCEICNAGLCKEMDRRLSSGGSSERTVAQELALVAEKELGYPLYSGKQLRDRYRYHKNKDKKGRVYSSKNNSQEQLQSLVPGSEVAEIPPVPDPAPTKSPKENSVKEPDNFQRLWKHVLATSEGLTFFADGTIKPTTEDEANAAKGILEAGQSIIVQFARLGIDVVGTYETFVAPKTEIKQTQK